LRADHRHGYSQCEGTDFASVLVDPPVAQVGCQAKAAEQAGNAKHQTDQEATGYDNGRRTGHGRTPTPAGWKLGKAIKAINWGICGRRATVRSRARNIKNLMLRSKAQT
jgi:hypothetical protein